MPSAEPIALDIGKFAAEARKSPGFQGLAALYDLSDFAIAAVALALAPDFDRRYGDMFAALNKTPSWRNPTRGLLLDLACATPREREAGLHELSAAGRLMAERILLCGEAAMPEADQAITVDGQIRQLLFGEPGLDQRLSGFCALSASALSFDDVPVSGPSRTDVVEAIRPYLEGKQARLRLFLAGPPGCGAETVGAALAALTGRPLIGVDLGRLAAAPGDVQRLAGLLVRECVLMPAIVALENCDQAMVARPGFGDLLRVLLARLGPAVVATGERGAAARIAAACGFAVVEIAPPEAEARRRLWARALASEAVSLPDDSIAALATRYRLLPAEIATAAAQGGAAIAADADARSGDAGRRVTLLAAAARDQGGHELAALTSRIAPRFGWNDIVLTAGVEAQLREMCERAQLSAKVLQGWGFEQKLSLGRGISTLFAGPSGTGKTMAAEVVAQELGLDLFKVNLASVVSKYIGETEQNLDRIFRAAVRVNGILLFDEADALFGKRSEVRDARDRYANLEISYLLQKMEEFEGIAILSTNLHGNLDDAFMRRLAFITYFPFPEAGERECIWRVVWPRGVPLEPIDFAAIAAAYKLSGGNIKQAALSAAFYAASEDAAVSSRHVMRAIEREFQKMGRPLQKSEIILFADGWRAAS